MDLRGVALLVAIVAFAIAVVVWGEIQAKKRREALAAWARSKGLAFDPDRQGDFQRTFGFGCLRQGEDDRYAFNVMRGRLRQYEVCAFDYHYQTHSRDSKGHRTTTNHTFSAVILTPPFPIKALAIRKENVFDKVGEFMGFDDIDFELAEFSREFHVASPDRKWAFDVLHQEAMEFLMKSQRFRLEFQDGRAIAWDGTDFDPESFDAALGVVSGLIDRIPQGVIRDLKETA